MYCLTPFKTRYLGLIPCGCCVACKSHKSEHKKICIDYVTKYTLKKSKCQGVAQ